ncbi:MAG: phosphatidylserine decarboxylase family protein [Saprospiraceae bacterium]
MIHKEGRLIVALTVAALVALGAVIFAFLPDWGWPYVVVAVLILALVAQFFRNPSRTLPMADNRIVYAPADGKICVIEEVDEPEYFRDRRLQVSIFMSPLNVHVNRNPVGGRIAYFRYHPGKYLVAWHPKSSTNNERTTLVYAAGHAEILMRQIAGAVARRIRYYVREGQEVRQGQDMGFIRFGSRVDLFLPLDAQIEVKLNDLVRGNQTVIARLP